MLTALLAAVGTEPAATVESANQIVQIGNAFGVKPWLLLAQIINFTLVASILYFFVIRPIQAQLDARAKLIDEGLKRSEESARVLAEAQSEKQTIVTAARREAMALTEKTTKEVQAWEAQKRQEAAREAQATQDAAVKRIAAYETQERARAKQELGEIVVKLAEKSLEETLTPEQKTRFAQRVAAGLESS